MQVDDSCALLLFVKYTRWRERLRDADLDIIAHIASPYAYSPMSSVTNLRRYRMHRWGLAYSVESK